MSGAVIAHINAEVGRNGDAGGGGGVAAEGDGPGAGELEIGPLVQLAGECLGER